MSEQPLEYPVSRAEVADQFKRYQAARDAQERCARLRRETFGIAVAKDGLATEWQSYSRDLEESAAFLECRKVIPERWGQSSESITR